MAEDDKKTEQHANQDAEPLVNPDDGIIDMDALMGGDAPQEVDTDSEEDGEDSEHG